MGQTSDVSSGAGKHKFTQSDTQINFSAARNNTQVPKTAKDQGTGTTMCAECKGTSSTFKVYCPKSNVYSHDITHILYTL